MTDSFIEQVLDLIISQERRVF